MTTRTFPLLARHITTAGKNLMRGFSTPLRDLWSTFKGGKTSKTQVVRPQRQPIGPENFFFFLREGSLLV